MSTAAQKQIDEMRSHKHLTPFAYLNKHGCIMSKTICSDVTGSELSGIIPAICCMLQYYNLDIFDLFSSITSLPNYSLEKFIDVYVVDNSDNLSIQLDNFINNNDSLLKFNKVSADTLRSNIVDMKYNTMNITVNCNNIANKNNLVYVINRFFDFYLKKFQNNVTKRSAMMDISDIDTIVIKKPYQSISRNHIIAKMIVLAKLNKDFDVKIIKSYVNFITKLNYFANINNTMHSYSTGKHIAIHGNHISNMSRDLLLFDINCLSRSIVNGDIIINTNKENKHSTMLRLNAMGFML